MPSATPPRPAKGVIVIDSDDDDVDRIDLTLDSDGDESELPTRVIRKYDRIDVIRSNTHGFLSIYQCVQHPPLTILF